MTERYKPGQIHKTDMLGSKNRLSPGHKTDRARYDILNLSKNMSKDSYISKGSRSISPEFSRKSNKDDAKGEEIEYEFNTKSYADSLNNVRDKSFANLKAFMMKESKLHNLNNLYDIQMTEAGSLINQSPEFTDWTERNF